MEILEAVAIALVCVGCIVLAVEYVQDLIPSSVKVVITTDNETYHVNEPVKVLISLKSSKEIEDVHISIFGIKNSRDTYKISKSMDVNLTAGTNNITFEYTIPPCTSCSGISPGTYYINASVIYDDKISNATHNIIIEEEYT